MGSFKAGPDERVEKELTTRSSALSKFIQADDLIIKFDLTWHPLQEDVEVPCVLCCTQALDKMRMLQPSQQ